MKDKNIEKEITTGGYELYKVRPTREDLERGYVVIEGIKVLISKNLISNYDGSFIIYKSELEEATNGVLKYIPYAKRVPPGIIEVMQNVFNKTKSDINSFLSFKTDLDKYEKDYFWGDQYDEFLETKQEFAELIKDTYKKIRESSPYG